MIVSVDNFKKLQHTKLIKNPVLQIIEEFLLKEFSLPASVS